MANAVFCILAALALMFMSIGLWPAEFGMEAGASAARVVGVVLFGAAFMVRSALLRQEPNAPPKDGPASER